MAATALSLRFRRVQNPRSFSRLFSSDSPITTNDDAAANPNTNTAASPPPPNSFKSHFSDIKSSLNQHPHQQQSPFKSSFSLSDKRKPIQTLDEIRSSLSGFRHRTTPNAAANNTPPPPPPPSSSNFPGQISLPQLYNKTMGSPNSSSESGRDPNSFRAICQSLTQLHNNNVGGGGGGLRPKMTNSFLGQGNVGGPPVYGGSDLLLAAALGKDRGVSLAGKSTQFFMSSTPDELGRMLSKLRPQEAKNKFSLAELSERLSKARQMEEEEKKKVAIGQTAVYTNIRKSLQTIQMSEEDKTKKTPAHKLDILSQFGVTQDFMSSPPKKHLIEKYFHPDNMSSAEKLKIELKKVREEFKMSESDCGSARVQVAQLTTKIKHLSTVLHKKDKHSRKGLTAMVKQRTKLLKYLRRTDWDSYCLVLSKLGLRDNPDYKN